MATKPLDDLTLGAIVDADRYSMNDDDLTVEERAHCAHSLRLGEALQQERALTASLRTQLAAATERYERAVALHEETRARLCERLALTPEERAYVEDCRTLPERVSGPWPIATRLLAIIDRIAPLPAGQGGK